MSRHWMSVWLLVFVLFAWSWRSAGIDIVRDGQATATIVIPDKAFSCVKRAARELQYHVREATGATLELVTESASTGIDHGRVYLGACEATRQAGITTDRLTRNGFITKTVGPHLFLAGRDTAGIWYAKDVIGSGTLLAVYHILDRHLGVRWLWPGRLGEVIPKTSTIHIDALNRTVALPLVSSRFNPSYRSQTKGWSTEEARKRFAEDERLWLQRHAFSWDSSRRSQHAFGEYWARFGVSHPEFFNLLPDGTRRPDPYHVCKGAGSYVSMCPSDPGFHQQIVRDWLAKRTVKWPHVWVGENDTAGSCCCSRCLSRDVPDSTLGVPWEQRGEYGAKAFAQGDSRWHRHLGSLSDRYAQFYLAVQKLVQRTDPDAMVIGFAYANYKEPPRRTRLNDHILIHFVGPLMYPWTPAKMQQFKESWGGWAATDARMILRPNFMLDGHCMPLFTARKLGELLSYCHGRGMIGTEFDSNIGQYATQGPTMYVLARMNNAIDQPVDDILNEYYSAFGPAKDAVRDYFTHWERVSNAVENEDYKDPRTAPVGAEVGSWNRFYLVADRIFAADAMARGRSILERARQAAATDPVARDRVEFLEKGLKNAEMTLTTQRAYRRYLDDNDRFAFTAAVDKLDTYRASVERDNVANMAYLALVENHTWDRALLRMAKFPDDALLPASWTFMWDPRKVGTAANWYAEVFDDSRWFDVRTDGPWEEQPVGRKWKEEHGVDYSGLAWYRNTFEVEPARRRPSVRLVFGAVDEACVIWVNGKQVASRPYPYKGNRDSWREMFEVDVSAVVRSDRPNTLAVCVEDNAGAGGIWRPVWCLQTQVSSARNLIANGDFESPDVAWHKSVMSGRTTFRYDASHIHGGKCSGLLHCTALTDKDPPKYRHTAWARWYQLKTPVAKGNTYRFRAWVRTERGFTGVIKLWVIPAATNLTEARVSSTEGLWREVVLDNIVPNAETLDVYLNLMDGVGKVWFDDVELSEM